MEVSNRLITQERIVSAAVDLLAQGGRNAVSTRSVSNAAGVQPPTIYRLFGDMDGLLDAVASHAFAEYLSSKAERERTPDPVDDLRRGWDLHVGFGLANPEFYKLMYGQPSPGRELAAAKKAAVVLRELVEGIAAAGRLSVGVDAAALMIEAAGIGVTLTQIGTPPEARDPELSERTREAVLTAVTTHTGQDAGTSSRSSVPYAVTLKAMLPELSRFFSPGEEILLGEWLDRIAEAATPKARDDKR